MQVRLKVPRLPVEESCAYANHPLEIPELLAAAAHHVASYDRSAAWWPPTGRELGSDGGSIPQATLALFAD